MKRSQCKPGAVVRIKCDDAGPLNGTVGTIVKDDGGPAWPITVECEDGSYEDFFPGELVLIDPCDDFDECHECCDERPNWSIARAGAIMAGVFLALLVLLRRR